MGAGVPAATGRKTINIVKSEPIAAAGVVMAILYVLAAFGAPISPEQQAVMKEQGPIILAGLAMFIAWMRQQVYAQDTVIDVAKKNVAIGYVAGKEGELKPPATIVPPPPGDEIKKAA